MVVEKVVRTGKGVGELEELISSIPEIPTKELVTGFVMANTYSKKIDKFVTAIKKELVDNATQDGRFIQEGTADEKGHLYLEGVEGDVELKAEKRVYSKFDTVLAEEFLKAKEIYDNAVDVELVCVDVEAVYDFITKVAYGELDDLGAMAQAGKLLVAFEEKKTVSQAKVEALVTLGQIEVQDVKNLMDTKIQYAVKGVKK